MKRTFSSLCLFGCLAFSLVTEAQTISGQDTTALRIPTSAMPFLGFTPDARSAALGDAGVALSADANAIYWNPAKLVYAEKDRGVALSYTPWLRNLVDDMYFTYLSGYRKVGKNQVIGLSLLYFDLGTIYFTNGIGVSTGSFNSREYAATASYSRRLSRNFSMGVNLRYASSNLAGSNFLNGALIKPANTVAADISAYYENEARDEITGQGVKWAFGGMLSNLGGLVNYGTTERYFLPTNLRLGTAMTYYTDKYNKFNFLVDLNKLMVPTPPQYQTVNGRPVLGSNNQPVILKGRDPKTLTSLSGAFGSFSDAPDGFAEELREINISAGAEYWYNDQFAARLGYQHEARSKGDRKYFTAGIGIKLQQKYGIDFAYLMPVRQGSPLANTLRLSLTLNLDKKPRVVNSEEE
jgi:hypothetical protein